MNIDRTGQAGAGPSSLPDPGNVEASATASASNRPGPRTQAMPLLKRVRTSGSSSPDAAIPQAAAPAKERTYGFTDLPPEVMFKIRSKLRDRDAARMVVTSKAMNEIFKPRVTADHLKYLAMHPENSLVPPQTPAEWATYFANLIGQTRYLPEELRATVLEEVLDWAHAYFPEEEVGIEHIALAYLEAADLILDRQGRYEALCNIGKTLSYGEVSSRYVDNRWEVMPRSGVVTLARHFDKSCAALSIETSGRTPGPTPETMTPEDLAKNQSAQARWVKHVEMHPGDLVGLIALRLRGVFLLPPEERLPKWRELLQEGRMAPDDLRAHLLQALCDTTTKFNSVDDGMTAMAEAVKFANELPDPVAKVRAIEWLTEAIDKLFTVSDGEDTHDTVWNDRSTLFLLGEISKLSPEVRPGLLAPLYDSIYAIDMADLLPAFEIVLKNIPELSSVHQSGVMAALGGVLHKISDGSRSVVPFDRMWSALPEIHAEGRQEARCNLAAMIRDLSKDAQQNRVIRALRDAEKLPGADCDPILATLCETTDFTTDAVNKFCLIAAVVGGRPREQQAVHLRTLYKRLEDFDSSNDVYAMLHLINPMMTALPDAERASLVGTVAASAAKLPPPLFVEQIGALVDQAKTLRSPMREEAQQNILNALTGVLRKMVYRDRMYQDRANQDRAPLPLEVFKTIVTGIVSLPLAMRVPLLSMATWTAANNPEIGGNESFNDSLKAAARQLPYASRIQLRESLAAVNCRHLLGSL